MKRSAPPILLAVSPAGPPACSITAFLPERAPLALASVATTERTGPAPDTAGAPSDEDARLVSAYRGGERAAFDALVRRHQRTLYFFLVRQTGDRDEAAELSQRTFVKVFQKLDALRDGGSFRAWLFRIGLNLARNHARDHARFVRDDESFDQGGADGDRQSPSPADGLARAQESGRLRAAVSRLPERQRLTLELRVYHDLSFREVAEALGSTEGAAKVNFHHAVQRLKLLLGDSASAQPDREPAR